MPIFEYACRACGHEFETLVRAADTPSCARCASPELEKKLSVFAAESNSAETRVATAKRHGRWLATRRGRPHHLERANGPQSRRRIVAIAAPMG